MRGIGLCSNLGECVPAADRTATHLRQCLNKKFHDRDTLGAIKSPTTLIHNLTANNTKSHSQLYVRIDWLLCVIDSAAHPELDLGNSAAHLTVMPKDSLQQQIICFCNAFLAMNASNTEDKDTHTPLSAECLPVTVFTPEDVAHTLRKLASRFPWIPIPRATNEELTLPPHFRAITHS